MFNIARIQHDLPHSSKVGLVYTDRIDGAHSNRVFAADARLLFGSIYNLQLQGGGSRTVVDGRATTAPIWPATFNRDGRHFGFRYQTTGIHEDFQAASGFISRGGVITTNLTHRATWFGAEGARSRAGPRACWSTACASTATTRSAIRGSRRSCTSTTASSSRADGSPACRRCSSRSRSTSRSTRTTRCRRRRRSGPQILPFTGVPHIRNDDYVVTLNTPQFSRFSGSIFYIWGHDENFYEWSPATIAFATYALDWRPNDKIRVSPQYQLQSYDRRSDGTTVGVGRIPRLKVEYQVSRAIFVRAIGEYNAQRQDALRDDSRTNLPILIRDPATGLYAPSPAFERNRFRVDALFSYQPTPGTVFFAGYSSFLTEPLGLRFDNLRRTNDGFFLKASYLLRL